MTELNIPLNTAEKHNLIFLNRMITNGSEHGFTPKEFRTSAINNEVGNGLADIGLLISTTGGDGRTRVFVANEETEMYRIFLNDRKTYKTYNFRKFELIWTQQMGNDVVPYLMRLVFDENTDSRNEILDAMSGTVEGLAIQTAFSVDQSVIGVDPLPFPIQVEGEHQHVGGKVPPYTLRMMNGIANEISDKGAGGKHGGATATNTDVINFCVAFTSFMLARLDTARRESEVR